jgi:hypothetical protein
MDKMNKKGNVLSIIFIVGTIVTLLLMAPILVKLVIIPSEKFSDALATIDSTNKSVEAVNFIQHKFTSLFDWVILFFILFSIIILLISSFMIDVHPVFFVIYFIAMLMIMIFAPMTLGFLDRMYNCTDYMSPGECAGYGGWTYEIASLPITKFIYDNFSVFILSVMMLSGVIMYGKYRRSSSNFY